MIDVVPVDPQTVEQWEYLPYSGYFDGECDRLTIMSLDESSRAISRVR
jgi:hypothetical protein